MESKNFNISTLSDEQKVNYIKNLLFNSEINEALDILLKNEKKDLKIINLIMETLNDDLVAKRIKQQSNLSDEKYLKTFVYSKILATLAFYNKQVILSSLFKSLSEDDKKEIAVYEYQNKTNVSLNSKVFNKYCSKYKNEALNLMELDKTEILMLDEEKQKYNLLSKHKINKKVLFLTVTIIIVLFLGIGYIINDCNNLIKEYKGLIYPGIYLNDTSLKKVKIKDLKNVVEKERQRIQNGVITISNVNGEYKVPYDEIGIKVYADNLAYDIKKYNENLSFIKKVMLIKNEKKAKTFYLTASYDDKTIDDLTNLLQQKLNTKVKDDGLVIDENHNVYYSKGVNGFTLDEEKTRINIQKTLSSLDDSKVIKAEGKVIKNDVKYESLSSVNKKVSSYTTYFLNAGNRGHNISLASERLNGTVIMPGEVFSYLKEVGPYGASNGYLPAPIYLNGDTSVANGGGVCQLASTTYMAQLKAGLETVSRRSHTFAPNYVPKGLDATVYSTTTDYKFKNNYEYPVCIVSYVNGNYLTVDIWTNENALGGRTFEPYSIASNGGWLAYLKTIENGKVVETKYLDRSVYKAH